MTLTKTQPVSDIAEQLQEAYRLRTHDLKRSIAIVHTVLEHCERSYQKDEAAQAHNMLGLFYMIQCDFEQSHIHAQFALDYFKEQRDLKGIADARYTLGTINCRTDNYFDGLTNFFECLALYRQCDDLSSEARTLKSLGIIYEYFGDHTKAIEWYQKSIEVSIQAGDKSSESNAYNPLSGLYLKQGAIETAMEIIEKSISLKQAIGDRRGLAYAIYGRAKVYLKQKNYQQAYVDLVESLRLQEEADDKFGLAMVYNKFGLLYFYLQDLEKAKGYLNKTLELAQRHHIQIFIFKTYHRLYKVAKKENNSGMALYYLEQFLHVKNNILNKETYNLMKTYDSVSKIESLQMQATAQVEKTKIIEKKNAELDSFFYRVSHDLKGPITSLLGLGNLVRLEVKDEISLHYFSLYNKQVERMKNIITSLIELTRMTYDQSTKVMIDFKKMVDENINAFEHFEQFSAVVFKIDIAERLDFSSNWSLINSIMQNLIENAIKYSRDDIQPVVCIHIFEDGECLIIEVADNGTGISEEHQQRIFEMFYRANDQVEGSGLGLYIVKRAVEHLAGIIELVSEPMAGATFRIRLPRQSH